MECFLVADIDSSQVDPTRNSEVLKNLKTN